MCNGAHFETEFHWADYVKVAKQPRNVPARPGVYALRAKASGERDMDPVISSFLNTDFMKAKKEVEAASDKMLRQIGLLPRYAYKDYDSINERVGRLRGVCPPELGGCPILYLGGTKNLRQRLNQLAYGGHMADVSAWALLLAGWHLEVGWREDASGRNQAEKELKERYRGTHNGNPPALVKR